MSYCARWFWPSGIYHCQYLLIKMNKLPASLNYTEIYKMYWLMRKKKGYNREAEHRRINTSRLFNQSRNKEMRRCQGMLTAVCLLKNPYAENGWGRSNLVRWLELSAQTCKQLLWNYKHGLYFLLETLTPVLFWPQYVKRYSVWGRESLGPRIFTVSLILKNSKSQGNPLLKLWMSHVKTTNKNRAVEFGQPRCRDSLVEL